MTNKNRVLKYLKCILHSPLFWILLICFGIQLFYYSQVLTYEVCGDTFSYTYEYDPSFRTPVYPLFNHFIHIFTGDDEVVWFTTIAIIQRIVMFASIILFWFLICDITENKYVRIIATLIYGGTPVIFGWAACIMTEAFSIIEIVALLFFTVRYLRNHSRWDAFLSGVMMFLLIMTRPAAVYLVGVYAIFWCLQLFVLFRNKVAKKQYNAIKYGIIGFVLSVCGILGYCSFQKISYGSFSLSSVSYVNDLLIIIDSDLYKESTNTEMSDYISERKAETRDCFFIIWQGLMKEYDRNELEDFTKGVIRENWPQYINNTILKVAKWGSEPIGTIYNSFKRNHAVTLKEIAGVFFPISFGLIYLTIVFECLWVVIGVTKNRNLDWGLLVFAMLVGGNVAVTIIASPYEPERLCVTSISVLIINYVYVLGAIVKNSKGVRFETRINKRKSLRGKSMV